MLWTAHLQGRPDRVINATVAIGENIYAVGCSLADDICFTRELITVRVLNTKTYRWTQLLHPKYGDDRYMCAPFQRTGHSAVAYGKIIYLWGGTTKDGLKCDEVFSLDTTILKWNRPKVTGEIPPARNKHLACVLGNCMYIIGGYESTVKNLSHDVFVLNLNSLEWRQLQTEGDPPFCVSPYRSASVIGKRIYILGRDRTCCMISRYCVRYLDTVTGRWHRISTDGNVPLMWQNHATFVHGEHIYVFGGYDALSKTNDVYLHRFQPETNIWESIKPAGLSSTPLVDSWHACVRVTDKVYILSGRGPCRGIQYVEFKNGAFGCILSKYRGIPKYLHILDFTISLRTLCLNVVLLCKLDTSSLPKNLREEIASLNEG